MEVICQLESKRVTPLSLIKLLGIHVVSWVIHMEYEEVETGHKPCGVVYGMNQQAWGYV